MDKIFQFARTLLGHFSNFNQAQNSPKDFARINIYFLPLTFKIFGKPAIYSEQSYDYDPWRPYRQGFHNLEKKGDILIVNNFGHSSQQRVAGAGISESRYEGNVEPGNKCFIPKNGKLTYLVSEVELNKKQWISRDRGYDIKTNKQCWGSIHGLLKFDRVESYSELIDEEWIRS